MCRNLVFVILISLDPGLAHGLQQLTVSQATFGTVLGRFITETTKTLLDGTETIKTDTDACVAKIRPKADSCGACVDSASCGDQGSAALQMLLHAFEAVRPDTHLIPVVEQGVEFVTNEIAGAAKAIYNRYGEDVVNELAHGFGQLGGKLGDIGTRVSDQLTQTVDDAKRAAAEAAEAAAKAAEAAANAGRTVFGGLRRVSRWFGKRKRRALRLLPKIDLPKLTEEQKRCASKCPSCTDFLHDDYLQTLRAVCGNSYVDKLVDLDTKAYQLQELAKTWVQTSTDKRDFLTEIWVDPGTSGVFKLVFWRNSYYGTYFPNPHIPVDPWNLDPMYKAIVLYIFNIYKAESQAIEPPAPDLIDNDIAVLHTFF